MSDTFIKLHLQLAGRIANVDTIADLPGPDFVLPGEVRYVAAEEVIYYWDGDSWQPIGTGGDGFFDNLVVNNLTVNNIAHINANVVDIGDNIIVLNSEVTGTPTEDAGIVIERGNEPDAQLIWNETLNTWTAGVEGDMHPFPGVSPAFTLARQGAVSTNTWLLNNGVPSNLTGIRIFTASNLTRVFVESSSSSTYEVTIYQHDHAIYTVLTVLTVTGTYGNEIIVDIPLTLGQAIAARVTSGTATDPVVGLILEQ